MKNKMDVHFSSKTDMWSTPQWLFDELNTIYGPFDLDVCASPTNAKCKLWLGEQRNGAFLDGLNVYWHNPEPHESPKIWMNPPYGREIGKWIKKAYEESQKGCLVVCLLPARTDTKWFHDYIYTNPNTYTRFLKGRLKFGDATNSAPFPSMVVVFHPVKI